MRERLRMAGGGESTLISELRVGGVVGVEGQGTQVNGEQGVDEDEEDEDWEEEGD